MRRLVGGRDDVTVVVVSYNVAGLLGACLRSVRRALGEVGGGTLVVVDNASADGSVAVVRREFPEAVLIENGENRGFGAACNQALARADGEAVLFLNPDAELLPGALPALLRRLRANPAIALVAPQVQYPDGREQPVCRRFPTLGTLLVESTPLQWRFPQWVRLDRYYCRDLSPERLARVDWLSGACLLGRTQALRQVGGFSPSFFMYFEEVDLARRMAAAGWQVWYEPAARLIHHQSQSADQDLCAKDRQFYGSKYCYIAGYWGGSVALAVRLWSAMLFAVEWALQWLRRSPEAGRYRSLVGWHLHGLLRLRLPAPGGQPVR